MTQQEKNRKDGYYKVQVQGFTFIAKWSQYNKCWYLAGTKKQYNDEYFASIDENMIKL